MNELEQNSSRIIQDVVKVAQELAMHPEGGTERENRRGNTVEEYEAAAILQALVRSCPCSSVHSGEEMGGGVTMRVWWPRRLASDFRIQRATAMRLEAAARRRDPMLSHMARITSVHVIERVMYRAIIQRRYRAASMRNHTRGDVPGAMKRRLFVDEGNMDIWDVAKMAEYKAIFSKVEAIYVDLREAYKTEVSLKKELAETVAFEDRLYNDVTRGGGGGLVRELGGQKLAKRKLVETQETLETLRVTSAAATERVDRQSRDIKWAWTGGWDSLASQELLVQEGHQQCVKGAYVCLASRYVEDKRFAESVGQVGRLMKRHSQNTWWVDYVATSKKTAFAVGDGGVYHLRYATEVEKYRAELQEQDIENERKRVELLAKDAARRAAATRDMAPIDLFYNRNPIRCVPYIPITQAVTAEDMRYQVRGVNYAAAVDDPRQKPPTQTLMTRVMPSCNGLPPYKFSWEPTWPARQVPSGVYLDEESGEVTGAPLVEEEVSVMITCVTADGRELTTSLRFECTWNNEGNAGASRPATAVLSRDGGSMHGVRAPKTPLSDAASRRQAASNLNRQGQPPSYCVE